MELHEDMLVMQSGQVMRVRNGEMTPLEEETTMLDGTRIMTDGTVVLTDGTTRMMAEGEVMRMAGSVVADTPDMPDIGSTEETTGTETHDPT